MFVELFRRRGHETSDQNEPRPKEGIKTARSTVIAVMLLLLLLGCVMLLYIGSITLEKSRVYLKTVELPHMHARVIIQNDTVRIEQLRVSLRIQFGKADAAVHPSEVGTHSLSMKLDHERQTIVAVSRAPFRFSEKEQIIVLQFEPSEVRLQEKGMTDFQKRTEDGHHLWMRLDGDLKMEVRVARFIHFPQATRKIHYGCDVVFDAPNDKIVFQRCGTFDDEAQK